MLCVHKYRTSQAMQTTTDVDESYATISTESHKAYGSHGEMKTSAHLPTPSGAYKQQQMEMTHNQAYNTVTNIPVRLNQCSGTTPSADHTTRNMGNIVHTSQQPTAEEDDYVIPYLLNDRTTRNVKREGDIALTSNQPTAKDYDYIIP